MSRPRVPCRRDGSGRRGLLPPALEQASGEGIAAYRAGRYHAVGEERVADLGCGIGGDSLALAAGLQVLGIDLDGLRLAMARANCEAYGRGERFQPVLADLREWLPVGVGALFFDPGRRRDDGRRIHSVAHYWPPLGTIQRWLPRVPHVGVKVSPGVAYDELPPGAEIEFISEKGTVKEAVLWFGDLRTRAGRRATLLPGGETLTDEPTPEIPIGPPAAFLYEPDGAVIRAHLVEQLAARLGAAKVDRDIAYLTADSRVTTPLARVYALEDHLPFNLKKLRAYLRARNVGRVVVKKRGSPLEPEELIRRHPSPTPQVLVVTDGQPTAYFQERELRVEWPMGFGGVSPHAVAETLKTVRRVTRRGITINTFMLDDSPELVGFVERMTEINKGRAFFTSPGRLGVFLMVDYLSRRRAWHR